MRIAFPIPKVQTTPTCLISADVLILVSSLIEKEMGSEKQSHMPIFTWPEVAELGCEFWFL